MTAATLTRRSVPRFNRDGVVAMLDIPKIGLCEEVRTGQGNAIDRGVTRCPFSPVWGGAGTIDLVGHRTTHTAPFFWLGELDRGDDIFVLAPADAEPWHYRVIKARDLVPVDDPLLNVDPREKLFAEALGQVTNRLLVLRTCSPAFSSKSRLLVTAECVNPDRNH